MFKIGFIYNIIYGGNSLLVKLRNIKFLRNLYLRYFKKFDGKIRIYLTFNCNLNCPYCVNKFHGSIHPFNIISGNEWIKIINREKRDVILTGGEPTLHRDFIDIINGINPNLHIKVYTNLKWSDKFLSEYITKVKRPVKFYASYHISSGNPKKFLYVLNKLKKAGKFRGFVHTVCSDNKKAKELKRFFAGQDVKLAVDDNQYDMFEGCSKKFKKKVNCANKIFLIAPNGVRFRCLSYMLRNKQPLENLKSERLSDALFSDECTDYGYCAPCDMLGEIHIKKLK